MKSRRIILRVGVSTWLSVLLVLPVVVKAATPVATLTKTATADVLVTEIQAASASSAGEEFVELYNTTNGDINFGDTKDPWRLQYFSSTKFATLIGATATATGWSASPTRTINLTGTIHAHDYYVLAAGSYAPGNIQPDQSYASTLADEGAVQLVDLPSTTSTIYHDRVLWSNDTKWPAGYPLVPAPKPGSSVQRMPNENTEYVNEDGSLTSFAVKPDISPEGAWVAPEVINPEVPTDSTTPPTDGTDTASDTSVDPAPLVTNDGLDAPVVTEILPNPASPQTDESDEFIELYNPNDSAFNLKGYTLETGATTLHDFTFTSDTLLQPNSYQAFFSSQTNLSLSNSGGQARLLNPAGALLSQTDAYGTASEGQTWALDQANDIWHWTTTATPNQANIFTEPVVTTKVVAPKKTTAKAKTASAKVKGTSTTKTKKVAASKKPKTTITQTASATANKPAAPIHAGVLAAVAALAVAYGIYEYRHDMANRIYQFRTNRAARRSARK